jgi:hypothetical protein
MKRKKKQTPVLRLEHEDTLDCWCGPSWVSGRINAGALLHREDSSSQACLRLEEANKRVKS